MTEQSDYLVVGAGLAGLAFAKEARLQGATVRVLDKGRGVGGRMATRRLEWDGQALRVDHGAQFFTARSSRFQTLVDEWLQEGWLSVWSNGFPLWQEGAVCEREPGHPRYAPTDGMNAVAKRLAVGMDVVTGATVNRLERVDGGYTAYTEQGVAGSGRHLVLNLPPAQLLPLAQNLLPSTARETLATVTFYPAWTLIALLEEDLPVRWPALELEGHPVLGWISRDHTKRPQPAPPVVVAHGSGKWSQDNLEADTAVVQEALLDALTEVVGPITVRQAQVHRWRYALPTRSVGVPFMWDESLKIGCCGDWCSSARVEGALLSGWGLSEAIFW